MSQRLHILGICGTFMGGLALLARELGFEVSGSDANVYPPMSTQLAASGITLMEGYAAEHLQPAPDLVVVGNAMSRGNPAVEYMLNRNIPYVSGPQWLGEQLLAKRWVLAVSGTHGKTTTTGMLAWILEYAGYQPGFLVGGVPGNFDVSARLGGSDFFVIEADEYDTAFFDKRSKFIHYRPHTLVIGNVEYDHADIFPDLAAIERQFQHLLRCVPGEGRIIRGAAAAIDRVLSEGVWTPVETLNATDGHHWHLRDASGSHFEVVDPFGGRAVVEWTQVGLHNVANGTAAIAAARHVGVPLALSVEALNHFKGIKRRLELRGTPGGIAIYDDFAHHPTAIETTLTGLRAKNPTGRILAVIEPRSNTMRGGEHIDRLGPATTAADCVFWYQPPGLNWSLQRIVEQSICAAEVVSDIDELVVKIVDWSRAGDTVVIMSNGSFSGLHERVLAALTAVTSSTFR